MTNIHQRLIHDTAQDFIRDAEVSTLNHLERIGADPLTKQIVNSLLQAYKASNKLNGELLDENERLKAVAK